MKRSLSTILLVVAILIVSCGQDSVGNSSNWAFMIGNTHYKTLASAVSSVSKDYSVDNTIRLVKNVVDAGAVIDRDVLLDFGSYSYTLNSSNTGIAIQSGAEVKISGGLFKSGNSNKTTQLINNDGNLTIESVSINLSGHNIDAIRTNDGIIEITGETTITTAAERNIFVAGVFARVTVDSSDTVLTGGLSLSGNANIILGSSTLKLTRNIEFDGNSVNLDISETKIEPQNEDVDIEKLENIIPAPIIISQPGKFIISPVQNVSDVLQIQFKNPSQFSQELKWYRSSDGNTFTEVSINDPLPDKGIYYFRCGAVNNRMEGNIVVAQSVEVFSETFIVAWTGLPTVFISTPDGIEITREDYIANTDISIPSSDLEETIQIKGRGNSSWNVTDKKGYNIKFNSKTKVLGMKKAKKWSIVSNYFDKSLLRNWLSGYLAHYHLSNNGWNPSYEYFDFVLNGEYRGNYVMVESIQINDNRLNMKNIEDCNNENLYTGGFILEVDFRKDADHWFETEKYNIPFTLKDPDFDDVEASIYVNYMKDIIKGVEEELSDANFFQKNVDDIRTIDVPSFVDWYIVEEFAKNLDADFFTSVYVYYKPENNPEDNKIHMGPHWDFDFSFGNNTRRYSSEKDCSNPEGYWINNCQDNSVISWYEPLLSNDSFLNAIKIRWNEIKESLIENLFEAIDLQASKIAISAEMNFLRWDILGKKIAADATGYDERTTFQSEVEFLKEWIQKRYDWLDKQWGNQVVNSI